MSGQYNGPNDALKITVTPQDEDIILGYVPGYISVENITNGSMAVWSAAMASGEAIKTLGTDGVRTFLSTGGFVVLDGSDGNSRGIRIPSGLADINDTNAEELIINILREAEAPISQGQSSDT